MNPVLSDVIRKMGGSKAWPVVFEAGSAEVLAIEALRELLRHGCLNEKGVQVLKEAEGRE